MPQKISREEQVNRFYRRKRIGQVLSVFIAMAARILSAAVTLMCMYWVFADVEAIRIKGIAAAALAVLLYAQCASLSMVGLRLFAKSTMTQKRYLALSSILICAPLYFVVLVISIIPLTEHAAFFITVFPPVILNILPMESVRDEMSLRAFPSWLFWTMQIAMQMLCFAAGQMYGHHLMIAWG